MCFLQTYTCLHVCTETGACPHTVRNVSCVYVCLSVCLQYSRDACSPLLSCAYSFVFCECIVGCTVVCFSFCTVIYYKLFAASLVWCLLCHLTAASPRHPGSDSVRGASVSLEPAQLVRGWNAQTTDPSLRLLSPSRSPRGADLSTLSVSETS